MTDKPIREQSALELLETHAQALEAENERLRDLEKYARRWRAAVGPDAGHPKVLDLVAAIDRLDSNAHETE